MAIFIVAILMTRRLHVMIILAFSRLHSTTIYAARVSPQIAIACIVAILIVIRVRAIIQRYRA
jgi:hypothetical protein